MIITSSLVPFKPITFPFVTYRCIHTVVTLALTAWITASGPILAATEELERRPEYCLDLTSMYALLRFGISLSI